MGKCDHLVGGYLNKPERFADFCNGSLYGGKAVISAQDLLEVQKAYDEVMRDRYGRLKTVGRERDVAKLLCRGQHFVLIAVENQSRLSYCMPFRCMEYDVMDLAMQLRRLRNRYQENGELKTSEEFLSGIRKSDRLIPNVTIVFYHGKGKWKAPAQLYEMLDVAGMDETLENLLENYRIHVICLEELKEENFKTGLRELIGLMKRRDDKNAMKKYCAENAVRFEHIDEDTYDVICRLLNLKILLKGKAKYKNCEREDFNMCKAFDEMVKDGEMRGEKRGEKRGKKMGEERLGNLMEKLLKENRLEEALNASRNISLRKRLYQEYGI